MFRHKGKGRTYEHDLRLAALLSFIAGLVNITGVLNVNTLTTNVTGHFAFFAEELVKQEHITALIFLLYIFSFLSGAFISSLLTEYSIYKKVSSAHAPAMIMEILILLVVGLRVEISETIDFSNMTIAGLLLVAMGMQNALVTKISNSVVRTTHLTGLFTDLGIELSQLFFYKREEQIFRLNRSIALRIAIITFFFLGCVFGGFLYFLLSVKTLIVASVLLIIALFYDNVRLKYYQFVRKKETQSTRRGRLKRIRASRRNSQ
jgi:uncharacterized membrane protein YoaK (UPF0700 family)